MIARGGLLVAVALFAANSQGADARAAALMRLDVAVEEATQSLQTAAARMDVDAGVQFDSGWSLRTLLRIRADHEERLEPSMPSQEERSRYNRRWFVNDAIEVELRELYIDAHFGPAFVRIGKQQTVWGQADGLRVIDFVNPFSFREFIWPDPQDRRIALWTLKTEVPLGAATLQLLWIPDPTYDELPAPDAAFAITTPLLIPQAQTPVPITEPLRPSGLIDGSDAGARLAAFVAGWDVTLNYLYHYYDDPVPFIARTAGGPIVAPAYERSRLTGMTFSNAFASTTIRGEFGHSTNRWFLTNDANDADRVFASDEAAFVIGIDNTALTNTLISAQYFESRVLDPVPAMTRSRTERQATFLVQRLFRNDSIKFRALWLRSMNRHDGGVQVRLSWQTNESLTLGISIEHFYGDPRGLFGEFREASRAGVDVQWGWQRE